MQNIELEMDTPMKALLLIASLTLPTLAFATFQVAGTDTMPVHQGNLNTLPKSYRVNPAVTLRTHKGELYPQVRDYLKNHRWQLHWTAKKDIALLLKTEITGQSVPAVLHRLFEHYPKLKLSVSTKKRSVSVK
ncbi:MAG: hypothetical protein COV52_09525 [Gammaproteobacteria bacterium CG11_big_fil_rev_8_21_14_0_20_46_22]|nr:MAG: hypothetical protein COW05_03635 [Gammaproteobacteria bacterium CG12_big_fil_rev_8_21_14_0_65_46_12]PIR10287.1 MAG: hypothetical protein COV52_09525 [Gammaproteobacteria bacterium CG11_big_fil_rev_8_21_14_0_20_46_22]